MNFKAKFVASTIHSVVSNKFVPIILHPTTASAMIVYYKKYSMITTFVGHDQYYNGQKKAVKWHYPKDTIKTKGNIHIYIVTVRTRGESKLKREKATNQRKIGH